MKKLILLLIALMPWLYHVKSQVGINCDNPHQSAIMQMNAPDKGLIVPRIYQGYRVITDTSGADGLLYFDTYDNKYYCYTRGRGWQCLNPFYSNSPAAVVSESTTTFKKQVQIDNSARVKDTMTARLFKGYGIIPVGGIIMWTGSLADFDEVGMGIRSMDGWALCNGREFGNVTSPDLRGRFIVGAINGIPYGGEDAATEVDPYNKTDGRQNPNYQMRETGGKAFHKLNSSESAMPSHYHTGITNWDGAHYHDIIVKINGRTAEGSKEFSVGKAEDSSYHTYQYGALNNSKSCHQHEFTTYPNAVSSAASAHENRPPYYALAFIIRVK